MILVNRIEERFRGSVISLGNFDGVHRGHRYLIKRAIEIAKSMNRSSGIMTFYPHPLTLKREPFPYFLTSISEKIFLLKKLGTDFIFIKKFTEEFRNLTAEEFISFIKERISPYIIVVGEDFRFGRGRKGDVEFLKKHFDRVEVVKKYKVEDKEVSSTDIRDLLYMGQLKKANLLLGYKYFISGYRVKGKGYASKLGFATINIKPLSPWKLIPHDGVYTGWAGFNTPVRSAIYIGSSPTLKLNKRCIEFHFVDKGWEERTFYRVFLDDWLSEEKEFSDTEKLAKTIKEYIEETRKRVEYWKEEFLNGIF